MFKFGHYNTGIYHTAVGWQQGTNLIVCIIDRVGPQLPDPKVQAYGDGAGRGASYLHHA